MTRSRFVGLVVCVAAAVLSTAAVDAVAQVQSAEQQACINALNKAGTKVAATQAKENAACLKNAAAGVQPNAQACLTADAKLKVTKAMDKTGDAEVKKCTTAPDFGRASVATINGGARNEEVNLVAEIFGPDLTPAVISAASDSIGAACQLAVMKAYEKVAATKLKVFLKCKKAGLKAGTIFSQATLEACFDTVAADGSVAKAVAKLGPTITKKCPGVNIAAAFPGVCASAIDFPACVDTRVECRACLMLDAMDGLGRDCDLFDDGVANGSCDNLPPTPTPTSTPTATPTPAATATPGASDWGLGCFASGDCGSAHCPMFGAQCTDYIKSIGLTPGTEMCFFDCMDTGLMDVTDCRDACGGSPAPACETGTAGGGGASGVVTGPGKCTPSGFGAAVTLGGTATLFKRLLVDFATPISEASLFSAPPPPCPAMCPGSGSACDGGAPYAATPLADVFRIQIGAPVPPPDTCDRVGVATSVCKFSPTGYAIVAAAPGVSAAAPIDLSVFISCHVSDAGGTSFLHFSTGDFFATTTLP